MSTTGGCLPSPRWMLASKCSSAAVTLCLMTSLSVLPASRTFAEYRSMSPSLQWCDRGGCPGRYSLTLRQLSQGLAGELRHAQEDRVGSEQVNRVHLGAIRNDVRDDGAADVARGRGGKRQIAAHWHASGRGDAV